MSQLKISVLDVGHGDFVYAVSPTGDNLVIDCGTGDVIPSSFLEPVKQISELQISHPHTDHFDDIIPLSRKKILSFRCPSISIFSDNLIGWKKSDKAKIAILRELKRTKRSDNAAVNVGNGFGHTVWFPKNVDPNNPNSASLVTTLSYKAFKMLFGGDLPESGWNSLLQESDFVNAIKGTTVFKVPHHGRKEGCCTSLFNVIFPKLCIISDKALKKDNKNTAATDWYTDRSKGCNVQGYNEKRKVLSTRSDGSIHILVSDEGRWTVHPNTTWK